MAEVAVKLFVFCMLVAVQVKTERRSPVKIGVILDDDGKSNRQNTLIFAWSHYMNKLGAPNVQYKLTDLVDISNNHKLISSICEKVSNRSIMMVVDYHPVSYSSVQSYAHYLNIPTLVPGGSGSSVHDPYRYDISLLPPTIDAIIDIIYYLQWNTVVYYLFDTDDGLLRLQRLYEAFAPDHYHHPIIRARRASNVSDCYDILRKIDRGPLPKRVVLDLSSRFAYEQVLHQIVDVGMNRDGYHYLLGGLGITELDLSTFVYGGVNITGFSIVDNRSSENAELIHQAQRYELHQLGKITIEEALIIDTVHVLLEAVVSLNNDSNRELYMNTYRGRQSRVGSVDKNNCSGEQLRQTFDGEMVLEHLKNVKLYGLTGNIDFDENGIRQNYIFHVHQLEHKLPLREVGIWAPKRGLNNMTLPKPPKRISPSDVLNRTLRVTTIKEEPFVQYKKSADGNGAPMVDGKYLEGFCVDLAVLLQAACDTPFDYYIDLVGDGKYGTLHENDGCWDGMIGELITTSGCPRGTRSKADMAIAPLTINRVRQRAVDFTKPFMQTGISIMIKKPDKEKPGVFSFMYPLANYVWMCVMIAFVAVSLVLFFVGRWSPYEWADQDPKGGVPINNFNILNTFWFSLGALMQQGSDTFPRSYSGRIVGSAWWFFTLILISSYTANLAAFLTIERLTPPINGADDLVSKNGEIEFGTISSGSSVDFFEKSTVPTYEQMWNFMRGNFDKVMMPNINLGVQKVRNSKGKYAFLMESAYNEYHNQRKPCNTMKVGTNLDSKGYGIATPLEFYLKNPLNLAVLKLREGGELMKLEQKWWYSKGMCGTDKKDATTSALTLSNVSGVFHILVGGLLLAMVVALCEYLIHQHIRKSRQRGRMRQKMSQGVRIVRKEPLEALKEAGYNERQSSGFSYTGGGATGVSAPLVTFDSSRYNHNSSPVH